MPDKRYLSAQEAADALNISVQTLYAYVSRGLIRSESADESTRKRRYYAEDVEKLLLRKEASKSPESVAETALHWGMPSMESEITLILNGHLYYRGWDVSTLVQGMKFEEVAALLWLGSSTESADLFAQNISSHIAGLIPFPSTIGLLPHLQSALTLLGADDLAAFQVTGSDTPSTEHIPIVGARILLLMAHLLAMHHRADIEGGDDTGIAQRLAAAWCPHEPHAAELLNMALILCADHELNASSFTARVVASTGATLYQVVSAGLSALQGVKHGGYTGRVVSMLRHRSDYPNSKAFLADRLRQGEVIPGFRHKLYPEGDPRARLLIERITAILGDHPAVQEALDLMREYHAISGEYPTIDYALGMLERGLKLPDSGGIALFALGRSAGWVGHAIEQTRDGRLIRPRARYTGTQPRG